MATKISANPTRRLSVRSEVDYGWRYTVIGWSLESGHICDEKHLEKLFDIFSYLKMITSVCAAVVSDELTFGFVR